MSAYNYNTELNNWSTCGEWQKSNSYCECSLSLHFFFSCSRWVFYWGRGAPGTCFSREGGVGCIWRWLGFLNQNGWRHILKMLDRNEWGHRIRAVPTGWGRLVGVGALLLYNSVQISWGIYTANTSTLIHEEKERERMGSKLNEHRGKKKQQKKQKQTIIHNFVGFLLCFSEDSESISSFLFCQKVRVTLRAGAALFLSCVREASKRQLPVNWSAGRLGAARHWVKSSEVRRSCVSCRWRLGG